MADKAAAGSGHAAWVRVTHWIITLAVLTLVFSGFEILMVHPRLYWGKAGNDLTPALLELPISRNYKHRGYDRPVALTANESGPVSANRTYDIFNQNGWGRSLHFLAAWFLVLPGLVYLLFGLLRGHFRRHIWPRRTASPGGAAEPRPPSGTPGPAYYGALQKVAYSFVIFVAAPLMVATGLTMSPAVTTAWPFLLDLFGGYQSARTIHFFASAVLVLFVLVHVVMVVRSGFQRHMRAMTLGR
ncbi:MAG TPA: cytochrome b/b6 domain-containing protein [Thermoanaerobaculia bacterium]